MTRVLSGIQPTGDVHLGNYVGAIRRWAAEQHEHDAFHLVVDLHALTVPRDPAELRAKTLETVTVLLEASYVLRRIASLTAASMAPRASTGRPA